MFRKLVQKNGSLAVTSDERFGYDGWDTAKPGGVAGTENFDVWADLSSANAVTMRRVYGAGFDQPLARVSATGVTGWYLTDRQGSVRQVLDNAGTTVGSRDYSAFGAITATSGTGLDRYGYTAREWDSTLNLQYTRMRMYYPATGRFTREDQMGLSAGDVNLHRYVGNAATLGSDPSGLKTLWGAFWDGFGKGATNVGHATLEVGRVPLDIIGYTVESATHALGVPPGPATGPAAGQRRVESGSGVHRVGGSAVDGSGPFAG